MTERHEDTPARREVRERIKAQGWGQEVNNADISELMRLIHLKLTGQQKRDALAFVRNRMKTKTQADNLTKRLESL